jgi:hypothetical protein
MGWAWEDKADFAQVRVQKKKGHKSQASALDVTQIDASMRLNCTSARQFWKNGHHVRCKCGYLLKVARREKAMELHPLHTVPILHTHKGLALTSTTLVTENVSSGDVKSTFLVAACAAATSKRASIATLRIIFPLNITSPSTLCVQPEGRMPPRHDICDGVRRINQNCRASQSTQCPSDRAGSPDRAGPRLIAPARQRAWDSTHRGARGSAAAGRDQDHTSRDGMDGAAGLYGDSI